MRGIATVSGWALIFYLFAPALLYAGPTTTWDAPTSTNWNNNNNWDAGRPDATTDAEIGAIGNGTISIGNQNQSADYLVLSSAATQDWEVTGTTGVLTLDADDDRFNFNTFSSGNGFTIHNASSFTLTVSADLAFTANSILTVAGLTNIIFAQNGDIALTGSLDLGSTNPGLVPNGNQITLGGPISGTGGFRTFDNGGNGGEILINGTMANTFTGTFVVDGATVTLDKTDGVDAIASDIEIISGTLLLGGNDQIADSADLTLAGGTFATGGFDDSLGTLTLTADSVIDFAGGDSILAFDDFVYVDGTLEIWNWDGNFADGGGNDQLLFDNPPTSDLENIVFFRDNGVTPINFPTGITGNEVLPIPEPSSIIGGSLLGLAAMGHLWRRRRKKT